MTHLSLDWSKHKRVKQPKQIKKSMVDKLQKLTEARAAFPKKCMEVLGADPTAVEPLLTTMFAQIEELAERALLPMSSLISQEISL